MDGQTRQLDELSRAACTYSYLARLYAIVAHRLDAARSRSTAMDASTTTVSAVLATLQQHRPRPRRRRPDRAISTHAFSALSKIVLSLDMLLGRLELYPMLMVWRFRAPGSGADKRKAVTLWNRF
jgi:hypothetical protein